MVWQRMLVQFGLILVCVAVIATVAHSARLTAILFLLQLIDAGYWSVFAGVMTALLSGQRGLAMLLTVLPLLLIWPPTIAWVARVLIAALAGLLATRGLQKLTLELHRVRRTHGRRQSLR